MKVVHFKIEATKFTIVGAANFILTFVVFGVMMKVLYLNYILSLAIAWFIGTIFSYMLNFSWVFMPEKSIHFNTRFLRFLMASIVSITLNSFTLSYLVEHLGLDPFYVQMLLIPLIVIFNFLTTKFWALKLE